MRQLNNRLIYYVYEHYKPGCDEPFYVGMGHGPRAYKKDRNNKWWKHIVNKHGREVRFVEKEMTMIDALWLENICIVGWGRADLDEGPLVNLTDGGECFSGYRWDAERRKAQSGKNHHWSGKTNPSFGRTGSKNGKSKSVRTPLGIFESTTEAARAHGIEQSTMSYRCRRNVGYDYITSTTNKSNKKHPLFDGKIPVGTPLGNFKSITEAANAHNTSLTTITYRCQVKMKGYRYLDKSLPM